MNLDDSGIAGFYDTHNDSFNDSKINDEIPNERQRMQSKITTYEGPEQSIIMEPLKIVKFIRVISDEYENHVPFELKNGPLPNQLIRIQH